MSGMTALIVAAGRGERFGKKKDKLFAPLGKKMVIEHTLDAFENCSDVDEIVLVVNSEKIDDFKELARKNSWQKLAKIIPGGESRQDSVELGLAAVENAEIIAIHDGARPLVSPQLISACRAEAEHSGAAIAAIPVVDTLKLVDDHHFIKETTDRTHFFAAQTPQAFRREIILRAYRHARDFGLNATDDASLVEAVRHPVKIVMGSYENIKITTPTDLAAAEAVLAFRGDTNTFRIGYGYDIHKFAEGRKLYLGGIEFPGETGLLGHSDADVLLHAVSDALLGAASLGDIGKLFPNTDPEYSGIRSTELLERVSELLKQNNFSIANIDVTVVAERPKIAPKAPEIRRTIAAILKIPENKVSIKATTAEGLGAIGKGEGIECAAIALLKY